MLLSSLDTRGTLMHLFLFTNTAQTELVLLRRKEYATAINFPSLIPLVKGVHLIKTGNKSWKLKHQKNSVIH